MNTAEVNRVIAVNPRLMGGHVRTVSHRDYYLFYCTIMKIDKLQINVGSSSLAPVFHHAVPGAISRRCLAMIWLERLLF